MGLPASESRRVHGCGSRELGQQDESGGNLYLPAPLASAGAAPGVEGSRPSTASLRGPSEQFHLPCSEQLGTRRLHGESLASGHRETEQITHQVYQALTRAKSHRNTGHMYSHTQHTAYEYALTHAWHTHVQSYAHIRHICNSYAQTQVTRSPQPAVPTHAPAAPPVPAVPALAPAAVPP